MTAAEKALYDEMTAVIASDIQVAVSECLTGPTPTELRKILSESVATLVKLPELEFTRDGKGITVRVGRRRG